MKFTKVIREYTKKTLMEKVNAKIKPENDAYQNRKEMAANEIKNLLAEFNPKVDEILQKYNMDTFYLNWHGEEAGKSIEKIVRFFDSDIVNRKELLAIESKRRELNRKIDKTIEQIELECALGADKEQFMKMLDEVEI